MTIYIYDISLNCFKYIIFHHEKNKTILSVTINYVKISHVDSVPCYITISIDTTTCNLTFITHALVSPGFSSVPFPFLFDFSTFISPGWPFMCCVELLIHCALFFIVYQVRLVDFNVNIK